MFTPSVAPNHERSSAGMLYFFFAKQLGVARTANYSTMDSDLGKSKNMTRIGPSTHRNNICCQGVKDPHAIHGFRDQQH